MDSSLRFLVADAWVNATGPDITYFLDLVATENSGLMSGLSKFN